MGVSVCVSVRASVSSFMLWNDIKLVIAAASLRNDNGIGAKKNSIYYSAFISCSPLCVCECADRYSSLHSWR